MPLPTPTAAGRAPSFPLSLETDREVLTVLLLASVGGAIIAVLVAGVHEFVNIVQTLLFGAAVDGANAAGIALWRRLVVPVAGSLALGLVLVWLGRHNRLAIIDPVEANATEGGRMSGLQTLTFIMLSTISISIGGSVGFEAAMTQLGAGLLSVAGQRLALPRRALRCLVACGTAAGLTAIFDAPLTGTLYALELVIGGYAVRALLPTLTAAAASGLVTHFIVGARPIFDMPDIGQPAVWHYPMAVGIGVASAVLGIAVMRGATGFESWLGKKDIAKALRPVTGGLALGLLAIAAWQVMGPGHTVLRSLITAPPGALMLAGLLVAKVLASVACVGSGFRGGLFSASLLMGGILGALVHVTIVAPLIGPQAGIELSIAVGMTAVSASVIGTPVAILLLAIETTGLHVGIVAVALGVVISSHLTRRFFGYSFSTWKFHIRGQDLSGPRDIGRLRALTFADAPLTDPQRIGSDTRIGAAAAGLPTARPGEADAPLAVIGPSGSFAGFVSRARLLAAAADTPDLPVAMIAEMPRHSPVQQDAPLTDHIAIDSDGTGWFAVTDGDGRLIGVAGEAAVLRRYLHELHAADQDDTALFRSSDGGKPQSTPTG